MKQKEAKFEYDKYFNNNENDDDNFIVKDEGSKEGQNKIHDNDAYKYFSIRTMTMMTPIIIIILTLSF